MHALSDIVRTALSERRSSLPSFSLEVDVYTLLTDLRFTLRSLWSNTRVTMMAALTLALGIGASTVILSVTKGRGKNNYQVFVVIHLLQG